MKIVRDEPLYNNKDYSRILIVSRLWSIRGQTHNWRHHYKVSFPLCLKMGEVFWGFRWYFMWLGERWDPKNIVEVFNRYEKQEYEKKAVFFFFINDSEKYSSSVSVGRRVRLNQHKIGLQISFKVTNHCSVLNIIWYKEKKDSMLLCVCSVYRSQKTSKCGKNSDTLGYRLLFHFFVLTKFWRPWIYLLKRIYLHWKEHWSAKCKLDMNKIFFGQWGPLKRISWLIS